MAETCTCEPAEILLFPCSGGSNVGQIANQAAVELDREGVGRLFCLAGLGGHIPSMLESAKVAKRVVAIDGCPVGCAKATLEHTGFPPTDYTVVTKLDIKKNHNFVWTEEELQKVADDIKRQLGFLSPKGETIITNTGNIKAGCGCSSGCGCS